MLDCPFLCSLFSPWGLSLWCEGLSGGSSQCLRRSWRLLTEDFPSDVRVSPVVLLSVWDGAGGCWLRTFPLMWGSLRWFFSVFETELEAADWGLSLWCEGLSGGSSQCLRRSWRLLTEGFQLLLGFMSLEPRLPLRLRLHCSLWSAVFSSGPCLSYSKTDKKHHKWTRN